MSLRVLLFWLLIGMLVIPVVGPWSWLEIIGGLWAASLAIRC